MYDIHIITSDGGKCAHSNRAHGTFLHNVAWLLTTTKRIQMFCNSRDAPLLHAVKFKQIMSKIYKP